MHALLVEGMKKKIQKQIKADIPNACPFTNAEMHYPRDQRKQWESDVRHADSVGEFQVYQHTLLLVV